MDHVKFVPDRLVVGPQGLPVLESGYTEIHGVRIYPDRMVVGRYGQPEIRGGHAAPARETSEGRSHHALTLNWPRGRRR